MHYPVYSTLLFYFCKYLLQVQIRIVETDLCLPADFFHLELESCIGSKNMELPTTEAPPPQSTPNNQPPLIFGLPNELFLMISEAC